MSLRFEELDWRATPLGAISLRRRLDPVSGGDVYEVKLDDDFLMSSMFTEGEVELARLALAAVPDRPDLAVVVGGLGLGCTASAVLDDARVGQLVVVEALPEVVEWHTAGLLPLSQRLTSDDRCRLVHGDFFALAAGPGALDGAEARRLVDAVVVDIDHSPRHLLSPSNASFYTSAGLGDVRRRLSEGGAFALWSNDPPDADFLETLCSVFPDGSAQVVTFDNPLQGGVSTNTVYLGTASEGSDSAS